MKVVVGLGNPGEKYQKTRHNVGFYFLDQLADKLSLNFSPTTKFFAEVAKNQDLILVKPQTYMNDSGRAVRAVCDYYRLDSTKDLIVVHDDLDLELGAVKWQQGTGPKIHNGLLSIYQHLGNKDFLHLRIGVDGRAGDRSMPAADYVLAAFPANEKQLIQELVTQNLQKLLPLIGSSHAQH